METSLPHLRMAYIYIHNLYAMPGPAEITDFIHRALLLKKKLTKQGYVATRLRSSLQKFYGRHHELVDKYGVTISVMRTDLFSLS